MEVQNRKNEPATLEAGLDFWNRQEQKFQSLFGKEALKDKEFLKMKLRHYDRLWYQYKNAPLDIEGQLMRNMLKFQRRKIDKSMHRGLLRQIIRRVNTAVESNRAQKVQQKMENMNRLERYNENSPKPDMHNLSANTVGCQRKMDQGEQAQIGGAPLQTRREQSKSQTHNHTTIYKHRPGKSKGIHH